MSSIHASRKPKIFHGYWVLVATFLCTSVYAGSASYSFSLFIKPLQVDFGWGRGRITVAFTILYLVMGIVSPFVGRWVDRYGARRVIIIGAVATSLAFVSLGLMSGLWQFYISYATVGLGLAAIGPVPAAAIVSNWFKKRRGIAIGIMSMGVGAGGFVIAPLLGGYLIPSFGWRTSYLALAVIVSLLVPLVLVVIRTRPAEMEPQYGGVQPAGTIVDSVDSGSHARGLSLRMALATSAFWLIGISFFFNQFNQIGVLQSQVPHLEDIGFPVVLAASALGAIGLTSSIGKLLFGWICDYIQPKYACAIGLGLQLIGVLILLSVKPTSPVVMIWLYAIFSGLGMGSWLPTMSMLIGAYFGMASYGAVFGAIALFNSVGAAVGPLMAGSMQDAMNSYYWAFIIFILLYAVAIPAMLLARLPKLLQSHRPGLPQNNRGISL